MVQNLKISEEVKVKIDATMFAHLYDLPTCGINRPELNKLLNQLSVDNTFILGGEKHQFTIHDVSRILCIPNSGMHILENKKKSPSTTLERLFGHERPTRWKLEQIINDMNTNNHTFDATTHAKLWLLTLFTTFLLPDSGTGVHHSIIAYIDDFDHIGDYNWSEYVHRILFSGINSGRTYCIGCAWVLLVCGCLIFCITKFSRVN